MEIRNEKLRKKKGRIFQMKMKYIQSKLYINVLTFISFISTHFLQICRCRDLRELNLSGLRGGVDRKCKILNKITKGYPSLNSRVSIVGLLSFLLFPPLTQKSGQLVSLYATNTVTFVVFKVKFLFAFIYFFHKTTILQWQLPIMKLTDFFFVSIILCLCYDF